MGIDILKSKLKEHGKRITPQRIVVYNTLKESTIHPNAEELHQEIIKKHPNISLATVYQILNLFEDELRIVKSISTNHIKHYDIRSEFHIHTICPKCGEIEDIYSDKIKLFWENLIEELRLKPEDQIIKIYQVCSACSKKKEI
ncbi:MAG: putative Peroxide operon regulator [Promethearchaeota archaeon]|jgi:Fur family peroxide stress response transcriptional regulator|nr:MAG: putative Peroxide operon regulator [Candidatus Lokiarchaeota archaeon]